MRRKRKTTSQKRTVKAIKRLARRTRVAPTRIHQSKKKPRKKPRTLEEHLKEEGWV